MRDFYRATRPVEPFLQACLDADLTTIESMLPNDRYPTLVADMAARQNWAAVRVLEIVRLLIEHGADRGVQDAEFNLTAAGWARYFGQREVARQLR